VRIAKIFFNTNEIILSRCRYKQWVEILKFDLTPEKTVGQVGKQNKTKQNMSQKRERADRCQLMTVQGYLRQHGPAAAINFDLDCCRSHKIVRTECDKECTSDHQLPKQEFLTNTWCWTKLHFQDLHTQEKKTRTNHFVLSGMKPKSDKITYQHSLIFHGERFMFSFFAISNFKSSTYCKSSINPPGGLFISKTFMGGGGGGLI